jgi:hypothetical protein
MVTQRLLGRRNDPQIDDAVRGLTKRGTRVEGRPDGTGEAAIGHTSIGSAAGIELQRNGSSAFRRRSLS